MDSAHYLARMERRIAELERRLENTVRHGVVKEIDTKDKKKPRVRLSIGNDHDGAEQLSPWVAYKQHGGDWKEHSPPTKGMTMTILAPGGDFTQAIAIPHSFSEKNESPSDKGDEHVTTYGDGEHKLTIKHTKEKTTISRGESHIEWSKDGITASTKKLDLVASERINANTDLFHHEGARVEHGTRNIGQDHKHLGVEPGGGKTGDPDA